MFHRILIANRGEIAVRVIRTCRELEVETVAVYSTADADALHVKLATEAVCIGPPKAADSYLNMSALLTAALETGCDAIHPGYGFLSENPEFADLCRQCGLKFIGPSGGVIRQMGNKAAARALMRDHGVPVVPGSEGPVSGPEEAAEIAETIGYPVLLKASSGGGGRGMRRVDAPEELPGLYAAAQAEAVACFGDGELYVEKLILHPRHIEFQILADSQGNVVHLGERDCSIQRKNQKLIEESPSRALSEDLRRAMGEAAVRAALEGLDSGSFGMILRAKGIVPAEDGTWLHFDFVPGEIDLRRGPAAVTGRLCVIGSQLDEPGVAHLFGV